MFKRGDVWWACIRHRGKKRQVSLETSNKKLAREIEAKIKAEIIEGRYFEKLEGDSKIFEEMMEQFMEEHAPTVSLSMQKSYRGSLQHLQSFFGGMYVSDISSKDISRYKVNRRKKGPAPATINRELAMLSKAFNVAIKEWEWFSDNPVSKSGFEREATGRDRWLPKEEARRLLSHSGLILRQIVTFALNTGMRQDEILSLRWPDVSMERRALVVMKTKNGRRRTLPLSDAACAVLEERGKIRHLHSDLVFNSEAGTKIDRHNLGRSFRATLKRAGIKDFRFHDLRHTCATWLAWEGHDIYFIARWLGHEDISMTQRYAHHCVDSLRKGVSAVNADYNLTTVSNFHLPVKR